eukprot:g7622.t1
MCSIRKRGIRNHVCGATLVASRWVMTAAYCIDPSIADSAGLNPLIYCGITQREERNPSKTFKATRCYLHHLWTGDVRDGHSIALCELNRDSSGEVPDLANPGSTFTKQNLFMALGWGTSQPGGQLADTLKMISNLRYISNAICNRFTLWRDRITDSMICAGVGDSGPCKGDGGGPLLIPDEYQGSVDLGNASTDLIVGINSFGSPDLR